MEMSDISSCFLSRGTANSYSSFIYPYGAHGPVSRHASSYNFLRYQAEGLSPIQSGVKTLPFLLSIVVCECDFLLLHKLITKLKIAAIISGALIKVQCNLNMRKLHTH